MFTMLQDCTIVLQARWRSQGNHQECAEPMTLFQRECLCTWLREVHDQRAGQDALLTLAGDMCTLDMIWEACARGSR